MKKMALVEHSSSERARALTKNIDEVNLRFLCRRGSLRSLALILALRAFTSLENGLRARQELGEALPLGRLLLRWGLRRPLFRFADHDEDYNGRLTAWLLAN